MPTTYETARPAVKRLASEVMKKYHGDLVEAGVSIAYLMASSDKGHAVKLNGYPCAATVKVIGLKERADGRADAEVVIDYREWKEAGEDRQRALIDHELYHLMLKKDSRTNKLKRDDLGRPLLQLKKHDHQFGWFDEIAVRHGDAAYEVKQAKAFADKFGQIYFGWATPPNRPVESAAAKAVATMKGLVSGDSGVTSITLQAGDGEAHTIAAKEEKPKKGRKKAPAVEAMEPAAAQAGVLNDAPDQVKVYVAGLANQRQQWFAAAVWNACTSPAKQPSPNADSHPDRQFRDVYPGDRQAIYDRLEELAMTDDAKLVWYPLYAGDDTEHDGEDLAAIDPVRHGSDKEPTKDDRKTHDPGKALAAAFEAATAAGIEFDGWRVIDALNDVPDGAADRIVVEVVRNRGVRTLGELRDALADGDWIGKVFPLLGVDDVDELVTAVEAYLDQQKPTAATTVSISAAPDFVTTFPEPLKPTMLPCKTGPSADYHPPLIRQMVEMQHDYAAAEREQGIATGDKARAAASRKTKSLMRAAMKMRLDYSKIFGVEAAKQLGQHVARLAADQVNPADEPGNTLSPSPDGPMGVDVSASTDGQPETNPADPTPWSTEPDAKPAVPAPADLGITIEQLEKSRGGVRPAERVPATLQAQWRSTVGVPVKLPDRDGLWAVVWIKFSTGSVTYGLYSLLAPDPMHPAPTWGQRRTTRDFDDAPPADVSITGVACTAADGMPYVFGEATDVQTVEVARGEWSEYDAARQAERDVRATQRAAGKGKVPA